MIKPTEALKGHHYIFDFMTLLMHLTFAFNHNPSLVGALLKHKDGKTLKFLIRNLYFLITVQAEKLGNKP